MCLDLYKEYGTTMAGLKVQIDIYLIKKFVQISLPKFCCASWWQAFGFEFDDDEFHACVHGTLPYDTLKPDPLLRNLLLSMPQRKIVRNEEF